MADFRGQLYAENVAIAYIHDQENVRFYDGRIGTIRQSDKPIVYDIKTDTTTTTYDVLVENKVVHQICLNT